MVSIIDDLNSVVEEFNSYNTDIPSKEIISVVTKLVGLIKPTVHLFSEKDALYQLKTRGVINDENVSLDKRFKELTCDANVVNFKDERESRGSSKTLSQTSHSKFVKINSLFPAFAALDSEYTLSIYSKSLLPKGHVVCEHKTPQMLQYEDLLIPCEDHMFVSLTKDGKQHTLSIPC